MPIVAPRRMTNDDVSNTPELSGGGGGAQLVPSRVSVVRAGMSKPSSGTVSDDDSRSPCGGGGGLPPSVIAGGGGGGLLPVDVTDAPTLSVEGPQSVPSRISMGPWLRTLQDGGVHVKIGIGDRGLA